MAARRESRAEQVAAAIEDDILASHAAAGTLIGRRADLIVKHAVSPSVLNEALRLLRDRGLVSVRPGPRGGVFVARDIPRVRLGGLDLWLQGLCTEPAKVLEAAAYLENLFCEVALVRATPSDVADMEWALHEMRSAGNARAFFDANLRLNLTIGRAARIDLLASLYESIVVVLSSAVARAEAVQGWEQFHRQGVEVHANLVAAIRGRDRAALAEIARLRGHDTLPEPGPAASALPT